MRGLVPAILAGVLLLSGCSEDAPEAAAFVAESTTTAASGSATAGDVASTTIAEDRGDPDAALAAAVGALGDTYSFDSTVTTPAGDQVAIVGHRIADAMTYQIQSGDASVQIVTIAAESWIQQEGSDEWLQSSEVSQDDPLTVLSAPLSVAWSDAMANQLEATYDASALDLAIEGSVAVDVTLGADSMTFQTTQNGTTLSTTLVRSADLAPITAPVE